jgi:hypothetical protein
MRREELKALVIGVLKRTETDHQANEIALEVAERALARAVNSGELSGAGTSLATVIGNLVEIQKRRHRRVEGILQELPKLLEELL